VEKLTADKPFPPGPYPLVIVGSGPGGLQLSYSLSRLGCDHAVISADEGPGGMFRKWPFFQRMLSWTKPFAPADRRSRQYERYDWNSLLADEEALRGLQADHMDGTSYFPSRQEMEQGLTAFATRAGVTVRYGCRWEATRREGGDWVLETTDGEYRAPVVVFAVGVAEPWRPDSPGVDQVPHYAEMLDAREYADKSVFIIGKKNSAFEIATGLLPWARRLVLASPSPAKTFAETKSLVGVRARYVQPFEDNIVGGGLFIVNAMIDRVVRDAGGYHVHIRFSSDGTERVFDADAAIAATGFQAPLLDLPSLGVKTFGQSALPSQNDLWGCPEAPGVYFAGTISQGAGGLKKHGVPSNSGAVHGHRYNARVLARHIAETHFGREVDCPVVTPAGVVDRLLDELAGAPGTGADIFHQRSYLARVLSVDPGSGVRDAGIQPLTRFLDDHTGLDAIAATLESDAAGQMYPALYVRQGGQVKETLLDPDPLLDYGRQEYRDAVAAALKPLGLG